MADHYEVPLSMFLERCTEAGVCDALQFGAMFVGEHYSWETLDYRIRVVYAATPSWGRIPLGADDFYNLRDFSLEWFLQESEPYREEELCIPLLVRMQRGAVWEKKELRTMCHIMVAHENIRERGKGASAWECCSFGSGPSMRQRADLPAAERKRGLLRTATLCG